MEMLSHGERTSSKGKGYAGLPTDLDQKYNKITNKTR